MRLYRASAANGIGFGMTFPTMSVANGTWAGLYSVGPAAASSFSVLVVGYFDSTGSGSIIWSAVPTAARNMAVSVHATFNVGEADGVVQLQARTSAVANQLFIQRGSYFQLKRVG